MLDWNLWRSSNHLLNYIARSLSFTGIILILQDLNNYKLKGTVHIKYKNARTTSRSAVLLGRKLKQKGFCLHRESHCMQHLSIFRLWITRDEKNIFIQRCSLISLHRNVWKWIPWKLPINASHFSPQYSSILKTYCAYLNYVAIYLYFFIH